MKNKKIGVIGGMGPYATLEFCKKILDLSPVKNQSEHIRILIDINPSIPNRTRAVFGGGKSPVEDIVGMIDGLSSQKVDFVVMPCNNATYFLPEILSLTKVSFVNIIDTTISSLSLKKGRKVAVLGTYITFYKKTYKEKLELAGFQYVEYSESIFMRVEKSIQLIRDNGKNGESNHLINQVVDDLSTLGADILVLGCTELSLIDFSKTSSNIHIVDSSYELAKFIVLLYFNC